MYYQNYEDYMRQVLGYPASDPRIYESYNYTDSQDYGDTYYFRNQETSSLSDEEIRNLYPDIYNLAYPMVCKVCETNTQPITKDLIEKMTDEIYASIEDSSTIVNIRVDTPKPETTNNRLNSSTQNIIDRRNMVKTNRDNCSRTTKIEDTRMKKSREDTKQVIENRQIAKTEVTQSRQINWTLRDLIKILLLERIFGNRPGSPRPPRPPHGGGPGRPPFPNPRPPMGPGGRPPVIQPRDYPDYL